MHVTADVCSRQSAPQRKFSAQNFYKQDRRVPGGRGIFAAPGPDVHQHGAQ